MQAIRIVTLGFVLLIPLTADAGNVDSELRSAAIEGRSDTVRALLANGADVNATDRYGWTPLMLAALASHDDTVQTLLANGAHVNAKGNGGATALIWAATLGHTDIVQRLVVDGADVDAKDWQERSALMWAARNDLGPTLQALLRTRYEITLPF